MPSPSHPLDASPDDSHPRLDHVLDHLALTQGRPRVVTAITGGLTNQSFRVQIDGHDLLVRVFAPDMELFGIDRELECANTRAAAHWGVAPGVLEVNLDLGALVSEFVSGRTLAPQHLADQRTLGRVTKTLRQLHSGSGFQGSFNVVQFRVDYLERVRELDIALPSDYDKHLPQVAALEHLLAATPEVLVPCHNDLAAENMIDDGERVWLVDFEFAAMNEASFDLANLALSSALADKAVDALVTAYWGSAAAQEAKRRLARVRAWMVVATFAWVPWAAIQQRTSPADFDFVGWAQQRYERAVSRLQSRQFELLADRLSP